MKTYKVNEIFYSPQGEGVRAGCMSVFVRLSGCNLRCSLRSHGFDCDTEFTSGRQMSMAEIIADAKAVGRDCRWIVLTGGEPAMQADDEMLKAFHNAGFMVAVETNGSIALPDGFDWITVSPKVAEHAVRQKTATEVKYVRAAGQSIPETVVQAEHKLISPAFGPDGVDRATLDWCLRLIAENPEWRLSLQQHKLWGVR